MNQFSHTMVILENLLLSSLKRTDRFIDFTQTVEFPYAGQGGYLGPYDAAPASNNGGVEIYGKQITCATFQYIQYAPDKSITTDIAANQPLIDAYDRIVQFLEDFYLRVDVTKVFHIFFYQQSSVNSRHLMIYYPGGVASLDAAQAQYEDTQKQRIVEDVKNAAATSFPQKWPSDNWRISDSYRDYFSNKLIITISRAIIDDSNNFIGVIGIDILLSDFNSIVNRVSS